MDGVSDVLPRKGVRVADAEEFGGSGHGNMGQVEAAPVPYHGRPHSLVVTVPPLGAVFFKREAA